MKQSNELQIDNEVTPADEARVFLGATVGADIAVAVRALGFTHVAPAAMRSAASAIASTIC